MDFIDGARDFQDFLGIITENLTYIIDTPAWICHTGSIEWKNALLINLSYHYYKGNLYVKYSSIPCARTYPHRTRRHDGLCSSLGYHLGGGTDIAERLDGQTCPGDRWPRVEWIHHYISMDSSSTVRGCQVRANSSLPSLDEPRFRVLWFTYGDTQKPPIQSTSTDLCNLLIPLSNPHRVLSKSTENHSFRTVVSHWFHWGKK